MVKIVEFTELDNNNLNFDIVDDLAIYMRNDPMFYRKEFYPAVLRVKGLNSKKQKINPHKEFGPMVDRACENYCRKFNINRRPEELMSLEDRKALVDKLFSEEMTNIRKGEY